MTRAKYVPSLCFLKIKPNPLSFLRHYLRQRTYIKYISYISYISYIINQIMDFIDSIPLLIRYGKNWQVLILNHFTLRSYLVAKLFRLLNRHGMVIVRPEIISYLYIKRYLQQKMRAKEKIFFMIFHLTWF